LIALLAAALFGCATRTDDGTEEAEADVPLAVGLDTLELVRGVLRIDASTENGTGDLSVSLGGTCTMAGREIGRGIANGARFVWSMTSDELADAVACGELAMDARSGRSHRRAALGVAVELVPTGEDETPAFVGRTVRPDTHEMLLTFRDVPAGARLEVGDVRVDASRDTEDRAVFVVPLAALARTVVTRTPISFDGRTALGTELAIGGATLDANEGTLYEPVEMNDEEGE
jgi:hypothetical protein